MKLNYGNIVLPNKLWKPGPNDHFGICKGSASGVCSAFNQIHAMFRSCAKRGYQKDDSTHYWLGYYFERSCYNVKEYPYEYSLMRPCPTGAHNDVIMGCHRLFTAGFNSEVVNRCRKESMQICKNK